MKKLVFIILFTFSLPSYGAIEDLVFFGSFGLIQMFVITGGETADGLTATGYSSGSSIKDQSGPFGFIYPETLGNITLTTIAFTEPDIEEIDTLFVIVARGNISKTIFAGVQVSNLGILASADAGYFHDPDGNISVWTWKVDSAKW